MCRDHVDETAVYVLREITPECVLKLVRGLYPNLSDTPYLGHKWWCLFFILSSVPVIVHLHLLHIC